MENCFHCMKDRASELKKSVAEGHVIHTFVSEHEKIEHFLDKLEEIEGQLEAMDAMEKGQHELLLHVAQHLEEAEPHHTREEDVLFPELEKRGIEGPPHVMREEHKILRKYKKELRKLVEKYRKENFIAFKKELKRITQHFAPLLREHIFKENNVLYPMALETIKDLEIWGKMKEECDKIGYCCFSPAQ